MTTPSNPQAPYSPFLPSTYNIPEDQDRIRTFLVDKLSVFADAINYKKIGLFMQAFETPNGEQYFYGTTQKTRSGYQSVAYIPILPNAGLLTLTLNTFPTFPIPDINPQFVVKHVWGSASKPCTAVGAGNGDYFSYMSQGDARISFTMSDTTIVITTTIDMRAYSGFIFIEHIRDGV